MPRRIPDRYKTYDELIAAIRKAGIESMQMIVGIDFSKSNEWTGEKSYHCSLHDASRGETPYIRALRIMSHIVKNFDDDDIYPVYRFGCLNTKDQSVLPLLYPEQDDPTSKVLLMSVRPIIGLHRRLRCPAQQPLPQ